MWLPFAKNGSHVALGVAVGVPIGRREDRRRTMRGVGSTPETTPWALYVTASRGSLSALCKLGVARVRPDVLLGDIPPKVHAGECRGPASTAALAPKIRGFGLSGGWAPAFAGVALGDLVLCG